MSIPSRSYSFNQNDEEALRPGPGRQHNPLPQQYDTHNGPVSPIEDVIPPLPPAHRSGPGATPGSSFQQMQTERSYGAGPPIPPNRESMVTPGAENIGDRAIGGGITDIASDIADQRQRESGAQALRDVDNWGRNPGHDGFAGRAVTSPTRQYGDDYSHPYGSMQPPESPSRIPQGHNNYSNTAIPLAGAAYGMGSGTPPVHYADRSTPYDGTTTPYSTTSHPYSTASHSSSLGAPYMDNPYNRHSRSREQLAQSAVINPNDIYDDGDDEMGPANNGKRRSMLSFGGRGTAVATGGAALGAGALGAFANRDASGSYNAVARNEYNSDGMNSGSPEKSPWLSQQTSGKKRQKCIITALIVFVIIAAVVGGVVGGIVASQHKSTDGRLSSGQTAAEDQAQNGDLGATSGEIKALLNNNDLHRVFPGVDYTPLNAQYPECLSFPPSQNNVTRDVAILSQLTKNIRLYGTDCNQTEMVLHAIDRLDLSDVKVWLGVHLDSNETTNTRQLDQFYSILDKYGDDPFAGVIVGNEVLFRKDLSPERLGQELAWVRSNMTEKKINLELASADLGDNWTPTLASEVDVVMANIHPFFAGTPADQSANWTWTFWQNKDIPITQGLPGKRHVISEVGWPSAGGNDCGTGVTCRSDSDGSVAGIDEMNTFMEGFVCESLRQNYTFFWFEAFDEPWKIRFNTDDEQWEDKWGLLDVNRKLKPGVKIPECAGIPVPS